MGKRIIIFDFGGVLIDWNPRYVYRKIFATDPEAEWFLENICTPEWNLSIDAGKPFATAVTELCEVFPEWTDQISAFHLRWEEMLGGVIHDSVMILNEIQSRGFKVYGLTNWSAETFPIACNRYEFLQTFEGIVVSGEEKVTKPDPAIFKVLLDRFNLKPGNCIFIDDNPHNTAAAEMLGFHTIGFTDPEQLRNDLLVAGIL
ncbi:MAG: HAD family phosphatase [Bacteroidota bacterium]